MNPRRVRPRQPSLASDGSLSWFIVSSSIPAGHPPATLPLRRAARRRSSGTIPEQLNDRKTGNSDHKLGPLRLRVKSQHVAVLVIGDHKLNLPAEMGAGRIRPRFLTWLDQRPRGGLGRGAPGRSRLARVRAPSPKRWATRSRIWSAAEGRVGCAKRSSWEAASPNPEA